MALLIAAVVAYGFGHTVESKLFHPPSPRPIVLYVHAVLFALWVVIFATQAMLIREHHFAWHRLLGTCAIPLGAFMPALGALTAIVMAKFNAIGGDAGAGNFLILPLAYMAIFAALFGTAIWMRLRHPQTHKRLMLMATCTLTVAAFARFPGLPVGTWDIFTDALIAMGLMRDRVVDGTVHRAYRIALPLLVVAQVAANAIFFTHPGWWLAASHALMAAV